MRSYNIVLISSSSLRDGIDAFLAELRRANASEHTVRNYESDLTQFLEYLTPPDADPPPVDAIDTLLIREWLGSLYQQRLATVSMRRKLAAVRSLFKFMQREGAIEINVARLVRTPKAPKTIPSVMTAEQTNTLIDEVAAKDLDRPPPPPDLAIFDICYWCGLRF